jgi:hypothetical protein
VARDPIIHQEMTTAQIPRIPLRSIRATLAGPVIERFVQKAPSFQRP